MNISVDCKGLACPIPIIRLKKSLAQNPDVKTVFLLVLTDLGSLRDVPAFCQQQKLDWLLLKETPFIEFKIWRQMAR